MNLRRKLFTIFGGLALLALSTAGATVWAITQWAATEAELRDHYQRSLLLQRIRAATFRATREVSDALAINADADAATEFTAALAPVQQDFQRWAALAITNEEKQQVQQIRRAYETLVQDSQTVFRLLQTGQREAALQLAEGKLEAEDFVAFTNLTEAAVASDQRYRQIVQAQTQNTRQTAQWILMIAAFGVLSLILLLSAYLASDLFAPLREAEQALDQVAQGDLQQQLSEDRQDELGNVHRAFNRMVAAIAQRQQLLEVAATSVPASTPENLDNSAWEHTPSRLTLHTLVSQLRSRVTQLHHDHVSGNGALTIDHQAVMQQLDQLLQAVARVTEFGFPVDLNLAQTDVRALLYEVLLRFHEEFIRRHVSYELQIDPAVEYAFVDRLKLREVLGELVRNALAALPESGGQLGIRAALAGDSTELVIDVADNGKGAAPSLINQAFDTFTSSNQQPGMGLKLARAIVEQHGGQFMIDSQPDQGTYVQIRLPLQT